MANDNQKNMAYGAGVFLAVLLLGPYIGLRILPYGADTYVAPQPATQKVQPAQPGQRADAPAAAARPASAVAPAVQRPEDARATAAARAAPKRDPQKSATGRLSEIEELLER